MWFRRSQVVDKLDEVLEGFSATELAVVLLGGLAAPKLLRHTLEGIIQVLFVDVKRLCSGIRFPQGHLSPEGVGLELAVHGPCDGL